VSRVRATRRLLAKAWRESRARFWISVVIVAGLCLGFTVLQAASRRQIEANVGETLTYAAYLHARVYGGVVRAVFTILAVILGLGGLQRERAQQTLGFTLALPVSRAAHVRARAMVGVLQIVVLAALPAVLVPLGSALGGASYPWAHAAVFALRWASTGSLVFAIAFLCSVLSRTDYVALIAALLVLRVLPSLVARVPGLAGWPLRLDGWMAGAASSTVPWAVVVGTLAGAAGLVWLAGRATARERFCA
jgi:ABC-type transport system involved in multi-copper enzyme maturation permease subunit